MKLIDKNGLLADIEHTIENSGLINHEKEIMECIEYVDTVNAVPVRHGEWIPEQKNAEYCEFRCSLCDHSIGETDQFDENEVMQFSEWYRYCPNCGAKMEEEK